MVGVDVELDRPLLPKKKKGESLVFLGFLELPLSIVGLVGCVGLAGLAGLAGLVPPSVRAAVVEFHHR